MIEFSAETSATQEWVEQIAVRQNVPLIVAASGAIAPTLRPYTQTGQIAALLEGYPDALAYEGLIGYRQETGQRQTAFSLVQGAFLALILVAMITAAVGAAAGARGRRS